MKNKWNMKVRILPIVIDALCKHHQRINKVPGGVRNKRTNRDHPNYFVIETEKNTEKSPGDLRELTFTQILVKDHQETLMSKTLKE